METENTQPRPGIRPGQQLTWPLDNVTQEILRTFIRSVSIQAFPVGSVFTSVVSTDPATLLGYGTWTAFGSGRTLVGIDAGQTEFDTVEETGGEKTHTLTVDEMPSHTHSFHTGNSSSGGGYLDNPRSNDIGGTNSYHMIATGGDGAHNNLQPYIVVYFWKRTA